jgi:hypothetical protein
LLHFAVTENPEPDCPWTTHLVEIREQREAPADDRWPVATLVPGDLVDSFMTGDPAGAIDAAVEAHETTLEERLAGYADRGW